MAKRKAARVSGRKAAGRKAAKKTARGGARKAARKATARKATARKAGARKAGRKATARKAAPRARAGQAGRKSAARKTAGRTAPKAAVRTATARKAPARTAAAPVARKRGGGGPAVPVRKAPALDRQRRTIADEDLVPTPPSSLDLDRSASAVRSGRRAERDRYASHNETSPALTGGDVDADWESAYSVGDEAPGGDNPTPDQDIVDDIGRAVGVEYQDNEELKGEKKITERDKHRWELDPASSEDYDDRD